MAPREAQEAPTGAQEASKMLPRPPRDPKKLSEVPKTLQEASTGGPFLCVLHTFLIEAIPLGI
eukprot:4742506-Pyramimonas_sp.AAC.1